MLRNDKCASTSASITGLQLIFTLLIMTTLSANYISEMLVHSMNHYVLPTAELELI